MKDTEVEALLGRPLTSIETTNFKTYLNIARETLDELLCTNLCDESVTRFFTGWEGYSTVWTDIFTEIDEVRINDKVVTNYSVRQGDRRSGSWYNSIVFDERFSEDEEVEIDASWGFEKMPNDLKQVLAALFGQVTKKNKFDGTVNRKAVEDFQVWIDTGADLDELFYRMHGRTIAKYSLCNKMGIKHGDVKC